MKRTHLPSLLLVAVIAVWLSGSANTQAPKRIQTPAPTPVEPKTQLEALQAQTGIVLIKGYSEIGSVDEISVECLEVTDASTHVRQMGIAVRVKELLSLAKSLPERSYACVVDYGEIEPLLKGIDYIAKATGDVTKLSSFEATYATTGGLKITTSNTSSGTIEASVRIGSGDAFLTAPKLAQLRNTIASAKEKLDSIK
jgi:hypothetical protein